MISILGTSTTINFNIRHIQRQWIIEVILPSGRISPSQFGFYGICVLSDEYGEGIVVDKEQDLTH
jgi:hypothetical protein